MQVSITILVSLFHLGSAKVLSYNDPASKVVDVEDEFVTRNNSFELGSSQDTQEQETSGRQDKTIYKGKWGRWMGWKGTHDNGVYACGAELRFEDSQRGGDDTAANGLKLRYCRLDNWHSQSTIEIYPGIWGGWKGMRMCNKDYYIDGAKVRYEGSQGWGDDTALNGLIILCRHKTTHKHHQVNVYGGIWGHWMKSFVYVGNKYVKFAQVRFEDPQGLGDDTAMNGLMFQFYTPGSSSSCKDGNRYCPYWKGRGYCNHSYVSYMRANCKKSCGVCT